MGTDGRDVQMVSQEVAKAMEDIDRAGFLHRGFLEVMASELASGLDKAMTLPDPARRRVEPLFRFALDRVNDRISKVKAIRVQVAQLEAKAKRTATEAERVAAESALRIRKLSDERTAILSMATERDTRANELSNEALSLFDGRFKR